MVIKVAVKLTRCYVITENFLAVWAKYSCASAFTEFVVGHQILQVKLRVMMEAIIYFVTADKPLFIEEAVIYWDFPSTDQC